MAATPSDIARYTTNGIVISSPQDPAVKAAIEVAHIDHQDGSEREIEMFYELPADAQWALDERFALLSRVAPPHLGIEVEESLDLGGSTPIVPVVPSFTVIDEETGLNATVRSRAYAQDMNTDRFSIEVL